MMKNVMITTRLSCNAWFLVYYTFLLLLLLCFTCTHAFIGASRRHVNGLTSPCYPNNAANVYTSCSGAFRSQAGRLIIKQHEQQQQRRRRRPFGSISTFVSSQNNGNNDDKPSRLGRSEGVYTRPSAAIERGSGFFVPGLEGPKVRLLGGTVLLLLTAVNRVFDPYEAKNNAGNEFAQGLAIAYSLLVLLQGSIEYIKEQQQLQGRIGQQQQSTKGGGTSKSATTRTWEQKWSMPLDPASPVARRWQNGVEWSAKSFLSLTPATHAALLGPSSILYWLGPTPCPEEKTPSLMQDEACSAAIDILKKSKGGRVALPSTHPVVQALAPKGYSRCVLLQRVQIMDDDSSNNKESNPPLGWMIMSDQLLAGYSPQDLEWLGQLGGYLEQL